MYSPEQLAKAVRTAHDVYVAAILAFRKAPSREARQRVDDAAIRHSDLMMILFDPARPYRGPGRKAAQREGEDAR